MPIVLVLVKPTLFWRTVYAYLTSLKPILVMVTALPRILHSIGEWLLCIYIVLSNKSDNDSDLVITFNDEVCVLVMVPMTTNLVLVQRLFN